LTVEELLLPVLLLLFETLVFVRVRTDLETFASESPEDVVPRLTVVPVVVRFVAVEELLRATFSLVEGVLVPVFTLSRVVDERELSSPEALDLVFVPSRNEVLRPVVPLLRREELRVSTVELLPDDTADRVPEDLKSFA
jgi:hypothetical protein